MQGFDAALKLLLQASGGSTLSQIVGLKVDRWLNVEMQQVQTSRADLLGMTAAGEILHVELQSTNDPNMALRMAEYCLHIYRQFRKFPKQAVLYAGEAKLNMNATLSGPDENLPDFAFRYTLLDFRELDGDPLLASSHIEDNVLAILANTNDQAGTIRRILARISSLDEAARRDALAKFLIISGLRRLSQTVKEEAKKMPITTDILEHDLIGPAIRQGRQEGRQEGRLEGRMEIVHRILEKRFGQIPEWAGARLRSLSASELDEVALRSFDAASFQDLFPAE